MKRTSRSETTRAAARRPEGWQPPNAMPMNIDLGPDVRVRWIRKYFNASEEDKTSFFKRMQRGWVPVKPAEVPTLQYLADADGNIACNGCVLCKIDAAIAQADVEYYEDMATGALASAKNEYLGSDHEYVPKFAETSKPRVFKGRLPS